MSEKRRNADVRAVLRTAGRAALAAGFLSLFVNVLQLTMPVYMMQVFDRVLASGSFETLFFLTLIGVVALVVGAVLDTVRSRMMGRIGVWLEQALAPEAFARALAAALTRRPYAAEATRDLGTLRGFIAGSGAAAVLDLPWVPVYLIIVWALHPALGIVAAFGALALFGLTLLAELLTAGRLREAQAAAQTAFTRVLSATRHAETVDAMGMLPGVAGRWQACNDESLRLHANAGDLSATVLSLTKLVRMGLQMAVLGIGAVFVVKGDLTGGAMIAGSILMSRALAPVEQVVGAWKTLTGARTALTRVRAFLSAPPVRPPAMALPAPVGRLAIEQVSFVHPGQQRPVLKGVSFAVQPGEVVAVTGPSAAGKSTLARLILGLWRPSAGVVRLDGADVWQWERTDFGRHVGYLPQDVDLFAGSVRDNIARMADADPEAVVAAARLAQVHELILSLSDGYDTDIGEGGAALSGGQRQRIALARAFFGRPRLLVLDEPDSNLDRAGEDALITALRSMKADGAAIVLIAHRAHLLEVVDKVLVLRDGGVEAFAPAAARPGPHRLQPSPTQPSPAAAPAGARPPLSPVPPTRAAEPDPRPQRRELKTEGSR